MKTFYTVHRIIESGEQFEKYDSALADAKRRQAADKDKQYAVMKAVAVTVLPIPDIQTEPLTE